MTMEAAGGDLLSSLIGLLMLFCLGVLYFLPTIIAVRQKAHYLSAAALVNFFFGLTIIGWVIALVLALSTAPPMVRVEQPERLIPATERGWYPDPCGRYEYRFYDGEFWTNNVSSAGVQGADPVPV